MGEDIICWLCVSSNTKKNIESLMRGLISCIFLLSFLDPNTTTDSENKTRLAWTSFEILINFSSSSRRLAECLSVFSISFSVFRFSLSLSLPHSRFLRRVQSEPRTTSHTSNSSELCFAIQSAKLRNDRRRKQKISSSSFALLMVSSRKISFWSDSIRWWWRCFYWWLVEILRAGYSPCRMI